MADHTYELDLRWTGNTGSGTSGYRDYSRDVVAEAVGKPGLLLSADRPFRGDPGRWNPEELLVAALSECHLLSVLHVAVTHGVRVVEYADRPFGTMRQEGIGGRFTRVLLRPTVTVAAADHVELMAQVHREAGAACFIASSVSFPVDHDPVTLVAGA